MLKITSLQAKIDVADFEALLGDDVKKQNEERVNKLIHYAKDRSLIPVLGSGISSPYMIPTWNQLTKYLFKERFVDLNSKDVYTTQCQNINDFDKVRRAIEKCLLDSDTTLSITPPTCSDPLEYAEYIRLIIAEIKMGSGGYSPDYEKDIDREFRRTVGEALVSKWRIQNSTLLNSEIRNDKLLSELRKGDTVLAYLAELVADRALDTITYNFDDLFELYLEILGCHNYNCISTAEQMRKKWNEHSVNIFHVHGRIQLFEDVDPDQDGQLIFAEKQYYEAEHYLYEWIHAIQAEQIHKKHMMFVGFSGQDYNFKRIFKNLNVVHSSSGNSCQHYIFLPLEDFMKEVHIGARVPGDFGVKEEDVLKVLVNSAMFMKERYLQSHGLLPIWVCYDQLKEYMRIMAERSK